jgi:hypothetical protein
MNRDLLRDNRDDTRGGSKNVLSSAGNLLRLRTEPYYV